MIESLQKHCRGFHIYIFAFDDLCYNILSDLNLKNSTIIPLREFETEELLTVKPTRTNAEYCWTCTPSTIFHVLAKFSVPNCTYIDADLKFFSDPSVLIEEMLLANTTVLITEHRFSKIPELFEKKRAGRFCVQFVTFLNDKDSIKVLERWKNQCIEWCFSRYEDGKFGDQKYLEEWPDLYDNIHILEHPGGGLAPWNADQYQFVEKENRLIGYIRKRKISFEPVFYHFQYVKFLSVNQFDTGWFHLPSNVRKFIYFPYLKQLSATEKKLRQYYTAYHTVFISSKITSFKVFLKIAFKKITRYNILNLS
jgi:hypothetical protein